MIIRENVKIREKEFIKTYSDKNVYIKNENDELYEDAMDPAEFDRKYTETDIPLEEQEFEEGD